MGIGSVEAESYVRAHRSLYVEELKDEQAVLAESSHVDKRTRSKSSVGGSEAGSHAHKSLYEDGREEKAV